MKHKILVIVLILALLVGAGVIFALNEQTKTNCDKLSVIYLKPSEMSLSQTILNKNPNAIVVFPELNQMNANTGTLNCPDFDYKNYVRVN